MKQVNLTTIHTVQSSTHYTNTVLHTDNSDDQNHRAIYFAKWKNDGRLNDAERKRCVFVCVEYKKAMKRKTKCKK